MSTQPINSYSPPTQPADHTIVPGVTRCPWCRCEVPFEEVYWSYGPRITCPKCQRVSIRKKYRVATGVTETCFFLLWLVLFPGLTALLTHSVMWAIVAAVLGFPLFLAADYLTDRRLAYLAEPKPDRSDLG